MRTPITPPALPGCRVRETPSPLHRRIALNTKFFEYSHARLPRVVSDVKTIAETTRSTGQGEVFVAEDLDDYARAVRTVLSDPDRYRAAYDTPGLPERWTWESQAEILTRLYGRLLRVPVTSMTDEVPEAGEPASGVRA